MFDRLLHRLREKIRTGQYVMSTHAEEEMDEDGLEIFAVEQIILSGKIIERQKDRQTGEWKYSFQEKKINHEEAKRTKENQQPNHFNISSFSFLRLLRFFVV